MSPITLLSESAGKEIHLFQSSFYIHNPFKPLVKGKKNKTRDKVKWAEAP